jgi:hypothetical protein
VELHSKNIVRQWVKEVFNEHRLDSVEAQGRRLRRLEPRQDGALRG